MGNFHNIIYYGLIAFVASLFLAMFALLFIYVPTAMKAEASCLEKGFPKARLTYDLKVYCLNMEGAVTTIVVPQ